MRRETFQNVHEIQGGLTMVHFLYALVHQIVV